MHPAELEIKDTKESITSAPYQDLILSMGKDGQLYTSIYDKRGDFNFHITKFTFSSSNISSSSAYGIFISQLIWYARACSPYKCLILRVGWLSGKLIKQGCLVECLKSSFRKFYCRYRDLIQQYEVSLSRMLNDILTLDQLQWLPNRSDLLESGLLVCVVFVFCVSACEELVLPVVCDVFVLCVSAPNEKVL